MTPTNRPNLIAPRPLTAEEAEELNRTFSQCAGFVKMMAGVANGCALAVMRDALDRITDVRPKSDYLARPRQPHPNYRHRTKHLFRQAEQEADAYRRALLHPATGELRFFHMADMPEQTRKTYGDITDSEYFELWEATGGGVYQECRPLITSLWNKYRLSLTAHQVPQPEMAAWGITAMTLLQLAVETWQRAMRSVHEAIDGRLSLQFVEQCYRPFSLQRVAQRWQQALETLSPETATYKLDSHEERNIALGINQLRERWVSPDLPFNATMQAVEDYDELFRTPGERKKALRQLAEMRTEAVADVERMKQEERRTRQ